MDKKYRKLNITLFTLYCAVMLWLLFNRSGGAEGIPYWEQVRNHFNPEPFHTIRLFLKVLGTHPYHSTAIVNLAGNVVMFIPLGFFLPRVFPALNQFRRVLLATTAIITAVELSQMFSLLGFCDIDDLILNVLGAALGYILHKLLK